MMHKFLSFSFKKIEILLRIIRAYFQYFHHFLYDFKRYSRHSIKKTYPSENESQLTAKIISLYHVIEKGLTMPNTKLGFGRDKINLLIKSLTIYKLNYSFKQNHNDNNHYDSAVNVLNSYVHFHKNTKFNLNPITKFLKNEKINKNACGGYYVLNKENYFQNVQGNFSQLTSVRCSFRDFSSMEVKIEDIYNAIKLAQRSPSTCNRQSTRIYLIKEKKIIEKLLNLQAGNRGFGHKINKLILIGYDINSYQGSGDRYTGYIDASLFAMTLIYSLTYLKLGSIALNWSKPKNIDIKLRRLIKIKDSHNIIFFIGIGHLNNQTKIAVSNRFNIDDIITEY